MKSCELDKGAKTVSQVFLSRRYDDELQCLSPNDLSLLDGSFAGSAETLENLQTTGKFRALRLQFSLPKVLNAKKKEKKKKSLFFILCPLQGIFCDNVLQRIAKARYWTRVPARSSRQVVRNEKVKKKSNGFHISSAL